MGSVWLAEHLTLATEVVVKFMAAALVSNAESRARFSREAAAASQVKSPHVVQMLDHGVTDTNVPFIVMERLEGEDLAARLERETALPPKDVVTIAGHVCQALARAHAKGIVHRDVKPQNVFLCAHDEEIFVKLLDFGIAKSTEPDGFAATRTGQIMGSPYYMSPEQAVGHKEIDHRTDLWSLGVLVFEALTGSRPFEATSLPALAIAIHSGPIPKPSAVRPSLPRAFDDWFARACCRDVGARFASAKELHHALARALDVQTPATEIDSTRALQTVAAPAAPDRTTELDRTGMDATFGLSTTQRRSRTRTMIILVAALVGVAVSAAIVVRTRARPRTTITAAPPSASEDAVIVPTAASTPAAPSVAVSLPAPSTPPQTAASSKPRRPAPPTAPRATATPPPKPTGDRPLF
jgi:serine/threonine-protein kinase